MLPSRTCATPSSRAKRELLTDSLDDEIDLLSSSDNEAAEARRDLLQLLEQLPDRQRLPIVHMKLEFEEKHQETLSKLRKDVAKVRRDLDAAEGVAAEARDRAALGATADHRGAVDAFLAKRQPEFRGRE